VPPGVPVGVKVSGWKYVGGQARQHELQRIPFVFQVSSAGAPLTALPSDQDNLTPAPLGIRGTAIATALIALTLVIAKSTYHVLVPLRE
jgi:hypothetical protein